MSSAITSTVSSRSRVIGGEEAVRRFMLDKFQHEIPEDYVSLTPDIVLYTWVSVFGRPLPAGRPGEKYNYVTKMIKQSKTMRDYVHVLFYSRWKMTNEAEMLDQVRGGGDNLIPVCLEDLPELYPPEEYDWVVRRYNKVYYMDFLRLLALRKAPRFKEVVRAKCGPERARALTGNAMMYVDIDVNFYTSGPREWLAPHGALTFMDCMCNQTRTMIRQLNRDLDSMDARDFNQARDLQGENCMVMVGYEYSRLFAKHFDKPELKFNALDIGRERSVHNYLMCFYQQATCIDHHRHHTHLHWAAGSLDSDSDSRSDSDS